MLKGVRVGSKGRQVLSPGARKSGQAVLDLQDILVHHEHVSVGHLPVDFVDTPRDSVFYDASAWSVVNFYNLKYKKTSSGNLGDEVETTDNLVTISPVTKTKYAYIMDWDDYNAPAALYFMQSKGLKVSSAFKPFSTQTNVGMKAFNYGSILVPVSKQKKKADQVFEIIREAQQKFQVPIYATNSGFASGNIFAT